MIYNLSSHGLSAGQILALIPILAITLISLFAGVLHFFNKKIQFYTLSKLNFCLQIIQLSTGGIKYYFYYGAYLTAGLYRDGAFNLELGFNLVDFAVQLGEMDDRFFALNLFPFIPLIILRWAERNPSPEPFEKTFTEKEPLH
jgi:hypothetical protein